MKPSTPAAFKLMMNGSAALCDIEQNGMRIDVDYLDRTIKETDIRIKEMQADLRNDKVYKIWRRRFGERTDLGSRKQLGVIIFKDMGVECKHRTKTGRPKTDVESLEDVDFPFVEKLTTLEKLKKVQSTYLIGVRRETVNGFVHPVCNLHLVITFRSSYNNPNIQNQPHHDPIQSKLIRTAFIPRKDHVILEMDYDGHEFRGAASFWQDKAMAEWANNPDLDIHRDMAAECYCLDRDQVTKNSRYFAKNQFVFPILYGSYYISCAKNLWNVIHRDKITTTDGVGLYDHLLEQGITELGDLNPRNDPRPGTFEKHIKEVEEDFNKKFPEWSEKKEKWWDKYVKNGQFRISTGFVCSGVYSRNQLMNTPIQGPSFHILLWSLIQINNYFKKHKMRSKILCQIHDSIMMDVFEPELQDVIEICQRIMTKEVRKHWKWISVPLETEIEVAVRNWHEKKEWFNVNGVWQPKEEMI